jgi:hypothetical protein
VHDLALSDHSNGRKSSTGAGSRKIVLDRMNAQQAVAKRSVGRRVTLLDAPFFCALSSDVGPAAEPLIRPAARSCVDAPRSSV